MKMVNIESNNRINSLMVFLVLLVVLFSVLLGGCEKAQIDYVEKGSISGKALDAETNEPLINVAITTDPASVSILTDDSGSFMIENVKAGEVIITAKKQNYRTNTINVSVDENTTTDVYITLEKAEEGFGVTLNNPTPADAAEGVESSIEVSWGVVKDGNTSDSVFYDVFLVSDNMEKEKVGSHLTDTTLQLDFLEFNTTYRWQVIAKDKEQEVLERSELWSFKTMVLPDMDIVFSAKVNGSYELFYCDTSSSPEKIQLTSSYSSNEIFPMMNPSNSRIAFSSNKDIGYHIYLSERDGTEMNKIFDQEIGGYHYKGGRYCWGASDNVLYFSYYDKLLKLNVSGGNTQLIATAPQNRHFGQLDWNENTNRIVVETLGGAIYTSEIYLLDDDGNNFEMLIDDLPGRMGRPSFSPDGQKILYTKDVDGVENVDGRMLNSHMIIHDIASSEETDISLDLKPNGTNDILARFSETGAEVIFVNTPNIIGGQHDIWMAKIDGASRKLLVYDGSMPAWY